MISNGSMYSILYNTSFWQGKIRIYSTRRKSAYSFVEPTEMGKMNRFVWKVGALGQLV